MPGAIGVRTQADGVSEYGRNTGGVRLISLDAGDQVIGLAPVIDREDGDAPEDTENNEGNAPDGDSQDGQDAVAEAPTTPTTSTMAGEEDKEDADDGGQP